MLLFYLSVEYFVTNIMNIKTIIILESWVVNFLISFVGNLWNRGVHYTLLSSLMYP